MAKKKTESNEYIALRGLTNDKTGKRFEVGDPVKDSDFSKSVIANWLEIGVLKKKDGK